MKVLVACEFSGVVRDAFTAQGHDAMSCDLEPSERPGKHYQGDVRDILDDDWELMIALPDCSKLTIAGAAYYNFLGREQEREAATTFFQTLQCAPIEKIAIENPIPFKSVQARIGKYDQCGNPFDFGTPERKRICLWLKNLPKLIPCNPVAVKPKKPTFVRPGRKLVNYTTHIITKENRQKRGRDFSQKSRRQWRSNGDET